MNPVQFFKRAPRLLMVTTLAAGAILMQTTGANAAPGHDLTVTTDDNTHTVGSSGDFVVRLTLDDNAQEGETINLLLVGVGTIVKVNDQSETHLPGDQFACVTRADGTCAVRVKSDEEGVSTLEAGFDVPATNASSEDTFAAAQVTGDISDEEDITWVEASDSDPYDTYDDDPGDPVFQFETPFENADEDPDPVEVAGTSQPVVTQQPEGPVVVAGEAAPVADAAPVALAELPRTGAAARQATMVAGLLLILGGVASLAGRHRKAHQA